MRIERIRALAVVALITFSAASCSSVPAAYYSEDTFQADTAKSAVKPLVIVRFLEKDRSVKEMPADLISPLLPALTFHGYLSEVRGGERKFFVTGLSVFDNWANGWTEAEFEASGIVLLQRDYLVWRVRMLAPLSHWGISSGEIRYYDSYFRGENGAGKVSVRMERIKEAVKFLCSGANSPPFFDDFDKKSRPGTRFRGFVEKTFFPDGPQATADVRIEDIPSILRPLLESETLYRDYEETLRLWVSLYNLKFIEEQFSKGLSFLYKD